MVNLHPQVGDYGGGDDDGDKEDVAVDVFALYPVGQNQGQGHGDGKLDKDGGRRQNQGIQRRLVEQLVLEQVHVVVYSKEGRLGNAVPIQSAVVGRLENRDQRD